MGKGAKYTKARRPVKLVYYEEYQTKEEAMKRECAIKRMGRKDKERMIVCQTDKKQEQTFWKVLQKTEKFSIITKDRTNI